MTASTTSAARTTADPRLGSVIISEVHYTRCRSSRTRTDALDADDLEFVEIYNSAHGGRRPDRLAAAQGRRVSISRRAPPLPGRSAIGGRAVRSGRDETHKAVAISGARSTDVPRRRSKCSAHTRRPTPQRRRTGAVAVSRRAPTKASRASSPHLLEDEVIYDDDYAAPWPAAADGGGAFAASRSPRPPGVNAASNWTAAITDAGHGVAVTSSTHARGRRPARVLQRTRRSTATTRPPMPRTTRDRHRQDGRCCPAARPPRFANYTSYSRGINGRHGRPGRLCPTA